MRSRYRLSLSGQVQGVGLRWQVSYQANKRGLSGWIRNTADGRVELEIEGEKDKITAVLAWVTSGAGAAVVTDYKVEELPLRNDSGFEIVD